MSDTSASWVGAAVWMVVGAVAFIAFVLLALIMRAGWRRMRDGHVPGRVHGFRCDFEGARLEADNIIRRVWVVPVVFTNELRRPAQLPEMHAIATVATNRRTRLLRRTYVHNGVFQWETTEPPNGVTFNPSASIAARITVELPVDELPVRAGFATLVNNSRGRSYTGKISVLETAPGSAGADVV